MEQWIHFARGPLFAFAFLVMVLGLARLLIVQVYSIVKGKGRRLRRVPWRRIAAEAATWVVPVRHLIPGTAAFSVVSYLFHIGILTTPVFLANHVVLWEGFLGVKLPRIGYLLGDLLTLSTIGCLLALLGFRICSRRLRSMSKRSDYVLLVAILLPFASGYMAMHPQFNPVRWEAMMLVHLLSAELLFVLVPFTKLAHVVLFFFDRVSLLHWQLAPGAGEKAARALYGEEARV